MRQKHTVHKTIHLLIKKYDIVHNNYINNPYINLLL